VTFSADEEIKDTEVQGSYLVHDNVAQQRNGRELNRNPSYCEFQYSDNHAVTD